jgi:geranylgeranylglycerol-phosphate geranylgeranyltransferase
MKLIRFFLILSSIIKIESLYILKSAIKPSFKIYNNANQDILVNKIKQKSSSFCKLIRYKNILPTLLLSFSGGFIMNPSIYSILHSPIFITSTAITVFIMACSMIINDIFDINVDKINNPERPLVTGETSLKEAIIYSVILLCVSEFLNLKFLPYNLQKIIHLILFSIIIYTPFLKRILFIKNLYCALLVSFSVFLGGISFQNNINLKLLYTITRLIFFGSLYNELLLDMADYIGDKKNKINTIPVFFGLDFSWNLANLILILNILFTLFNISYIFDVIFILPLLLIYNLLLTNLNDIKDYKYSRELIIYTVCETTKPLFLSLIYICSLTTILK